MTLELKRLRKVLKTKCNEHFFQQTNLSSRHSAVSLYHLFLGQMLQSILVENNNLHPCVVSQSFIVQPLGDIPGHSS